MVVKSSLENRGFAAYIMGEESALPLFTSGAEMVSILVPADQADEARDAIEAIRHTEFDEEEPMTGQIPKADVLQEGPFADLTAAGGKGSKAQPSSRRFPAKRASSRKSAASSKKSAKKPAKKSAKKTARKSAKKPAKKSAKKTARKSAKKSAKKPAKKSARKSPKKSAKKSAKKAAKKSQRKKK
jgi:hypothetical protein